MAGDRLPRKVMDAKKLASLLRGGPRGPLVIDSRSFVEYNSWHVLSSVNICCSKLVKRRLQQGKVTIAELVQPAARSQVPGLRAHPFCAADCLPVRCLSPSEPGTELCQVHVGPRLRQPCPPPLPNPKCAPQGQKVLSHPTLQAYVRPLLLSFPLRVHKSVSPDPEGLHPQGPALGSEKGPQWMSKV